MLLIYCLSISLNMSIAYCCSLHVFYVFLFIVFACAFPMYEYA